MNRSGGSPSVTDSLDRMVDAAQNVVGDQIALLKTDVSAAAASVTRRGALSLVGGMLIAIAWMVGLVALYLFLAPRLGVMNALLALSGLNLVPGLVLLTAVHLWRFEVPDV